jgi:hypothetical protein
MINLSSPKAQLSMLPNLIVTGFDTLFVCFFLSNIIDKNILIKFNFSISNRI